MRKLLILFTALAVLIGYYFYRVNDTSATLDARWASHSASSTQQIDHSDWQLILDDYLVTDTDSGVNLFDYSGLLDDGREPLDDYVTRLAAIDPLSLNQAEQKAYWINLYNVLTVQLILNHFPTASITNIGSNPLEFGPWNEPAIDINGISLSLNDIEHRIIRPLYNDYRIHFAVNCASIGCPNLAAEPYTARAMDAQLDRAASEFVNHSRGVRIETDELFLSSLFDWYAEDFGASQAEILATLGRHTTADITQSLQAFSGKPQYDYDWGLNGYCSIDNECGAND